MREDRKRISPTFDLDTYIQIKNLANKQNKDMADLVREWSIQGLNGDLNKDNLEFMAPIIRGQLKDVLGPYIERLAGLSAKACVQAGAAAYLSAEAIMKFVPMEEREEFQLTYEAARKKAVQYMRNRGNFE